MALPDFFIAGVPKAGTTALHTALARHPSLYMSPVKEPKFFLTDGPPPTDGGPGDVKTYREHVWRRSEYEALFDAARPGALKGESTPFYLYSHDAQLRIKALIPHAKLIVVLRDPIERAHSNWAHLWSAGLDPSVDFLDACAKEEQRAAAGWAAFWRFTGLGMYGEQLQHLLLGLPARTGAGIPVPRAAHRPAHHPGSGARSSGSVRACSARCRGRTSQHTRTRACATPWCSDGEKDQLGRVFVPAWSRRGGHH